MIEIIKNFIYSKKRLELSKDLFESCKINDLNLFNSTFEQDLKPDVNHTDFSVIDTLENHNYILTSCFSVACFQGNLEMVKKLVEHKCNVYAFNSQGFSAACKMGHDHIIKYLMIEANFNINEKLRRTLFAYNIDSQNNLIFSLEKNRNLYQELNNNLTQKTTIKKNMKI